MAQRYYPASQVEERNEAGLAFSGVPMGVQGHRDQILEQNSCYTRMETNSTSTTRWPRLAASSPSPDLNKALPQPPSISSKTARNPSSLRGFSRREPPSQLKPTHLEPEVHPNRYPVLNRGTSGSYHGNYSRSMPNSPRDPYQPTAPFDHTLRSRTEPSTFKYAESTTYKTQSCLPSDQSHPSTSLNPTVRENNDCRPRPHSWLPSTEPLTENWQPRLFAEAITGLPDETECCSSSSPPRLQGSHFARRNGSDAIPLLRPWSEATLSARRHTSNWQNSEPSAIMATRPEPDSRSRAARQQQSTYHARALEVDLGMLGLDDERDFNDELPNYTQSQAEISAQRQLEASLRARELEARWRNTRGDQ